MIKALNKLTELYSVLRLYVNFFQPSLKLISKQRDGAKVGKKYDMAKTPAQRLMGSPGFSKTVKEDLKKHYMELDPISLLRKVEGLQNEFWALAWKKGEGAGSEVTNQVEQNQASSKMEYGSGTRFYRRTRKPRKKVAP